MGIYGYHFNPFRSTEETLGILKLILSVNLHPPFTRFEKHRAKSPDSDQKLPNPNSVKNLLGEQLVARGVPVGNTPYSFLQPQKWEME